MNPIMRTFKNAIEFAVSVAVMLLLVATAITTGEYIMPLLFAVALMVPVTASFGMATLRDAKEAHRELLA